MVCKVGAKMPPFWRKAGFSSCCERACRCSLIHESSYGTVSREVIQSRFVLHHWVQGFALCSQRPLFLPSVSCPDFSESWATFVNYMASNGTMDIEDRTRTGEEAGPSDEEDEGDFQVRLAAACAHLVFSSYIGVAFRNFTPVDQTVLFLLDHLSVCSGCWGSWMTRRPPSPSCDTGSRARSGAGLPGSIPSTSQSASNSRVASVGDRWTFCSRCMPRWTATAALSTGRSSSLFLRKVCAGDGRHSQRQPSHAPCTARGLQEAASTSVGRFGPSAASSPAATASTRTSRQGTGTCSRLFRPCPRRRRRPSKASPHGRGLLARYPR